MGYIGINGISSKIFYLESDVGDIKIGNSIIDKGELDLNVGGANLSNISSKDFKTHSSVGDIALTESNIENKLDIKSGVGDININTKALGDIGIKGGTSDIDVLLSEKKDIYNYNLDCKIGDIEVDDKLYGKRLEINNNADNNIDIDCTAGGIELKFD